MDDELSRTADRQRGLLTRRQLVVLGVTREQLRWRLGRRWVLVLPHVVDVASGPLTESRRLVAAALEAGDDAVVTGHHACLWHGMGSARGSRPVVVLTGPTASTRSAGFVEVRRTRRPDVGAWSSGTVRIASRPRAVADAARAAVSDDEATALVVEAVQRRLVTLEQVEHEVEAGAVRGSARARRAVGASRSGAWSVPEADLLALCATSRVLPHVWPNPELERGDGTTLVSPDVWVDDVAMALMVHSRAHHARDADWEGTVERDGQLSEAGVVVLGFTPTSVRREPQRVLARVERTYLSVQASGRRRPDVRMLARAFGLSG